MKWRRASDEIEVPAGVPTQHLRVLGWEPIGEPKPDPELDPEPEPVKAPGRRRSRQVKSETVDVGPVD